MSTYQGIHSLPNCVYGGCEGCTYFCDGCGERFAPDTFDAHEAACAAANQAEWDSKWSPMSEGEFNDMLVSTLDEAPYMDLGFDAVPMSTRLSNAFMYRDDPYLDWVDTDDPYGN